MAVAVFNDNRGVPLAMCIFVGGGAFFVTVAWLRHGREGGENGFVEFVIGFLTQGP